MARPDVDDESTFAESEEHVQVGPVVPTGPRVFFFVSKHEIAEADAVEIPYLNGEKVWVGKSYIKFKQ